MRDCDCILSRDIFHLILRTIFHHVRCYVRCVCEEALACGEFCYRLFISVTPPLIHSLSYVTYLLSLTFLLELAGYFYLEQHQQDVSLDYLSKSHGKFMEWGAVAKCDALFQYIMQTFSQQSHVATASTLTSQLGEERETPSPEQPICVESQQQGKSCIRTV